MPVIEGAVGLRTSAGAPGNGTNEVQTLTIGGTPTGGAMVLGLDGQPSPAITWSATNATLLANINAGLDATASIGTSGIVATANSLTNGIGTITLTAGGNLAKKAINTLAVVANNLTGTAPTLAIAETTPGVDATERGAPKGALLTDTTNGKVYVNSGTALSPTWTVVGSQS